MKITTNCLAAIKNTIAAIGQLGKRAVTWIKSQFDGVNARIREFSIRFFTEVERTIIGRENYEVKLKLQAWVNDPSTTGMKAEAASRIFEAYRSKRTILNLDRMNLNSLPTAIGDLTNLCLLDLGYNNLTTLPEQIGNLTSLKQLYLSYNNLTTLPAQTGNLTNLENLSLKFNDLKTLPSELGNLTNLQMLFLDNNNLTALPEWIGNFTNLQTLYLYNNNLMALTGVERLQRLADLDVTNNPDLKDLPSSLGTIRSLAAFKADRRLQSQVDAILNASRALRNSHVTSN